MLNNSHEPLLKSAPAAGCAPHRLRIAITGFGPFPGVPFNASEELIRGLAEAPPPLAPGAQLHAVALPTDWRLAMERLAGFMAEVKPHVALHFGVSSRARGFAIERRAYNQTSGRADCSGGFAQDRCLRRGGPAFVETRLPAARIVQRLRVEGIAATLSDDPGRYLCNAVMFASLCAPAASARNPRLAHRCALAGFVHIPALMPPGPMPPVSGFDWRDLRRGAEVILQTLAQSARLCHGEARSGRPCISLR
jgi:pyroglutamyl-peptidase